MPVFRIVWRLCNWKVDLIRFGGHLSKGDTMSRPMADTPKRRARRQFTDEFKASAVRLVLDEGKTVGAAARDLDLTETALREWVKRAQADRTQGRTGLTTAEREELVRLRKATADRGRRARHLKKSHGVLREAEPVRFAFIAAKKAEHRVTILCRCMRVTRSGFYAWMRRGLSARAQRDVVLRTKLRAFHAASGHRYGRPRLWKDLKEDGEAVSEKRVRRLMREEQIQGRVPKRFKHTTNSDHDRSDRRQCARPRLHRGGAESTLGQRHDRVRDRRECQALSGGGARSVFALRRRLGDQRRQ